MRAAPRIVQLFGSDTFVEYCTCCSEPMGPLMMTVGERLACSEVCARAMKNPAATRRKQKIPMMARESQPTRFLRMRRCTKVPAMTPAKIREVKTSNGLFSNGGGFNHFGHKVFGLPVVSDENFLHAAGGIDDDRAQ